MRYTLTLALCVLLPAALLADPPGEAYQPKDGHYAVRFPGKPKETTQNVKTDLGTLKVHTATFALADGSIYVASFTEYPADAVRANVRDTLFDAVTKGLAGRDGKLVDSTEIDIGKEKGREVKIDKGKVQMRYRLAVKGDRLIQVGAIGAGGFSSTKDAVAFLDSLELK